MERQQQLAAKERQQREEALAGTEAAWGRRANALAARLEARIEEEEETEAEAEEDQTEANAKEEETEKDDDDDEFDWSDDDGPHPDETADRQRALVESFESEKKLQDAACACEELHLIKSNFSGSPVHLTALKRIA
nr:uncharacterized protein LOC127347357 [Lolium perenne]